MTFSIEQMANDAQGVSNQLAELSSQTKNDVLQLIADNLRASTPEIIAANQVDIKNGRGANLADAMLDRLMLDAERIEAIAKAVEHIITLDDPVGEITKHTRRPNGLLIAKQRIPLGVIAMVYESRPNVTIDAAVLCFKAGNAIILRGGKEAINSNKALASCIHGALAVHNIPSAAVGLVPDPDRGILNKMLTLSQYIDLVIPRGGEGLIQFVTETSQIPVIQHFKGVCHLYIDKDADTDKALALLLNGKVQRPGVCNSLETLLVHNRVAKQIMPQIAYVLEEAKVKVHACHNSIEYFDDALPATNSDYDTEYLALEIAIRIVDDFEQAVQHIQKHSSGHTEVIVSQDTSITQAFVRKINSAVVMVNASSRFSDGGELGLGAEIGISTSKLHAYGPMGLESLTTERFVVTGDGHIRT